MHQPCWPNAATSGSATDVRADDLLQVQGLFAKSSRLHDCVASTGPCNEWLVALLIRSDHLAHSSRSFPSTPANRARSIARARDSRDITVPNGMLAIWATSS